MSTIAALAEGPSNCCVAQRRLTAIWNVPIAARMRLKDSFRRLQPADVATGAPASLILGWRGESPARAASPERGDLRPVGRMEQFRSRGTRPTRPAAAPDRTNGRVVARDWALRPGHDNLRSEDGIGP